MMSLNGLHKLSIIIFTILHRFFEKTADFSKATGENLRKNRNMALKRCLERGH